MGPGIYKLIDGSLVHQLRFETISNNLANINTKAFKKDILSFNKTLIMKNISAVDFTEGPIGYTGNKLDVALETPGFFKVQTSQGIRYTRDGAFTLDADGVLINQNGDSVLGQNGPIRINGNGVSINHNGQVVVDNEPVDKILVLDFEQRQFLRKEGNSYYTYLGKEDDIFHADHVSVQQGYIEGSNVNPTEEMIKMIETFRAYESAQKAIQCIDEMNGKIINDPGLIQ